MKKTLIVLFLSLFIISCGKLSNENLNNKIEKDGSGKIIVEEGFSGSILQRKVNKLPIEEKLNLLLSEEQVISILEQEKNGNFLEELPRIESYYTKDAFYEFYILNSIKKSNIVECENINIEDKKQLCKDLFNSKNNEKQFIDTYIKHGEEEFFAKNMYKEFTNIMLKNKNCDNDNIIQYLSCKKMLDENADVRSIFIKYSILAKSDFSSYKVDHLGISKYWGMDEGFIKLIEKLFLETMKPQEKK